MSNHYGGTGGGHYTAYAKHPHNEKWFEFDDSMVQELGSDRKEVERAVVGSQAYSVFYRRRDKVDLTRIDFDMISKQPNVDFLEKIERRRAEKKADNQEEAKNWKNTYKVLWLSKYLHLCHDIFSYEFDGSRTGHALKYRLGSKQ